MKRLIKAIVLMALAASCAKETGSESTFDASTRRYSLSFAESTKTEISDVPANAGLPDVLTRTELSGSGSTRQVNWTSGDAIKLYTEPNQSSPASANVVLNGNSAYIDIEPGRADVIINAVYGASQLNSASSTENTMYVNSPVKNSQSYTSFSQAHICAAFSDDIENPNLTFHNAAAILKLTSAAAIHKVVFHGNNNEVITAGGNGSLKITNSSGALTVEPTSASGTSVTVQTGGAASDFYIAILPVNFSGGITVDCYDSNLELIATKKTTNAVNTASASGAPKVLNLGNIQDWLDNPLPVAVDLGLSVKWARTNIGATVPEEYGDYFAWGETAPKSEYKWTNYAYEQGTGRTGPFSKYVIDADRGTVDHKTVLDPADDAAHAILGGDWRMPTKEEVEELMTGCRWTWTTRNGVSGYRVTSNKSGYSGVSIFLPANGIFGSSVSKVGTEGNYWSASLSADESNFAISPYFSNSSRESGNCYRYFGLGIRPVEGAVIPVASIDMPATLDLIVGRTATLSATISPGNATYKGLTWSSSDESIATVDATGKVTAVSIGNATITAYSADASKTASCEVTVKETATIPNGYEYVDLGLPSGLKWATMNVGASKPEEYGEYFAWGETEPKSNYSWSTYKFELGTNENGPFSKYVTKSSYGTVDNKTVLDPEDDAAHVNWGGSWRMPTDEEWTELKTKCTWTWTTQNGVNGRLVTGPNGKSIFLPAAGYRYVTYLDYAGSYGYYWSSSLNTDNPRYAYFVSFGSDGVDWSFSLRYLGRSVRPVLKALKANLKFNDVILGDFRNCNDFALVHEIIKGVYDAADNLIFVWQAASATVPAAGWYATKAAEAYGFTEGAIDPAWKITFELGAIKYDFDAENSFLGRLKTFDSTAQLQALNEPTPTQQIDEAGIDWMNMGIDLLTDKFANLEVAVMVDGAPLAEGVAKVTVKATGTKAHPNHNEDGTPWVD